MIEALEPYVPSYANIASHPKLVALCERLNLRRLEAVGLVHLLWHYAARHTERGELSCPHLVLAEALFFPGEPEALFDALVVTGWIDVRANGAAVIHEWEQYQSSTAKKIATPKAKRLARLRAEEAQASTTTPEVSLIHAALMGDEDVPLVTDVKRIEAVLAQHPQPNGYEVALDYMAWQLEVARQYRETGKGKPHTNLIRGWANSMRISSERGWHPREQAKPATRALLAISDDDQRQYGVRNVSA